MAGSVAGSVSGSVAGLAPLEMVVSYWLPEGLPSAASARGEGLAEDVYVEELIEAGSIVPRVNGCDALRIVPGVAGNVTEEEAQDEALHLRVGTPWPRLGPRPRPRPGPRPRPHPRGVNMTCKRAGATCQRSLHLLITCLSLTPTPFKLKP